MRPKKPETTRSGDLFRARLDQIINLKQELAQLAGKIDWDFIDGEIARLYSDKGRPGIPTQFAIGLLLLKQIYGLCDEGVCERWVYDPFRGPSRGAMPMPSSFTAITDNCASCAAGLAG
jgi:transposase, IS5 family